MTTRDLYLALTKDLETVDYFLAFHETKATKKYAKASGWFSRINTWCQSTSTHAQSWNEEEVARKYLYQDKLSSISTNYGEHQGEACKVVLQTSLVCEPQMLCQAWDSEI